MSTHYTEIFMLSDGGDVRRIAQHVYAALVSGRLAMPEMAWRRVRVADWYVETRADGQLEISNETYSVLYFDDAGKVLLFPNPSAIEENKSVQAGAITDLHANAPFKTHSGRSALAAADLQWTPTSEERTRLMQSLTSATPRRDEDSP